MRRAIFALLLIVCAACGEDPDAELRGLSAAMQASLCDDWESAYVSGQEECGVHVLCFEDTEGCGEPVVLRPFCMEEVRSSTCTVAHMRSCQAKLSECDVEKAGFGFGVDRCLEAGGCR